MISESMKIKEEKCRRVCRWMLIGYMAFGSGLAVYYAAEKSWYLAAQSVGSMAAIWAILGFLRRIGIRPVYEAQAVIIAFTFAAYTLGVACSLYKTLPGYDKLLHMLSGTLTMSLALPLFYALKASHRVERDDCALAVGFCLSAALAVAGVWEIAEYALSLLADMDPQCAAATGVSDTMKDMIVCTLGALLAVHPLIRYYRTGRGGVLYGWLEVFLEKNLAGQAGNGAMDGET